MTGIYWIYSSPVFDGIARHQTESGSLEQADLGFVRMLAFALEITTANDVGSFSRNGTLGVGIEMFKDLWLWFVKVNEDVWIARRKGVADMLPLACGHILHRFIKSAPCLRIVAGSFRAVARDVGDFLSIFGNVEAAPLFSLAEFGRDIIEAHRESE